MAGLIIFIGIGVIVTAILRYQSRRSSTPSSGERLRELRERLERDEREQKDDPWDE
ncbi:MAG: hypothetical protein ACOCYB_01540 [Alkalispirochaeta sp.]